MSNSNEDNEICGRNNFKRARYFDGEILDQKIFDAEQLYHIQKRKLLNRMLHGWGVVCGLKVKSTNPPSPKVIIEPGLALDCHGNEILVCEEQTLDLSAKICTPKTDEFTCEGQEGTEQNGPAFYIVIKYQEVGTDPVPSYSSLGNCVEKTCDKSRVQEGFCIDILEKLPQMPKQNGTINASCNEPFICPTFCQTCCPDPHYIILATIGCGKRTDMFFSTCSPESGKKYIKIHYQIKRELSKVCIGGDGTNNIIKVNDAFKIKIDSPLNGIKWNQEPDKLEEDKKDKAFKLIGGIYEIKNTADTYEISYNVQALKTKGFADLRFPVSLKSGDSELCSFNEDFLKSPICLGTTRLQRGSIIYDAMIRNMENRQVVIAYPLLSWLLNIRGSGDGQLSSICELIMSGGLG